MAEWSRGVRGNCDGLHRDADRNWRALSERGEHGEEHVDFSEDDPGDGKGFGVIARAHLSKKTGESGWCPADEKRLGFRQGSC